MQPLTFWGALPDGLDRKRRQFFAKSKAKSEETRPQPKIVYGQVGNRIVWMVGSLTTE